jgi:hypothetical protein
MPVKATTSRDENAVFIPNPKMFQTLKAQNVLNILGMSWWMSTRDLTKQG